MTCIHKMNLNSSRIKLLSAEHVIGAVVGRFCAESLDGFSEGIIFSPPDNWTGRKLHYRVMQPDTVNPKTVDVKGVQVPYRRYSLACSTLDA